MKKKKEKLYRVSIGFPSEIAEVIQSMADNDDRSFNWITVQLVKAQLAQTAKKGVACNDSLERQTQNV